MSTTRRGRRAGLLAAFAAFGAFWGAWAAILPQIAADTGVGEGELGVALLVIAATGIGVARSAGRLADRVGPRLVPLSLLAFAFTIPLPALARGLGILLAVLALLGAAGGLLDIAMNSGVAAYEAGEGRRLFHLAHAMFPAGALTAAALAGVARDLGTGTGTILLGVSGACALAALVSVAAPAPAGAPSPDAEGAPSLRPLLAIGVVLALAFVLEQAMETWSALHLEETLGARPAIAGLGPAIFSAAILAGRLAGQVRTSRRPPGSQLAKAAVVGSGGIALAALAPWAWLALAGFALGGLGVSIAAPVAFQYAAARVPAARRGAAIARVALVGYVGFLLGPPLVGGIASLAGLRVSLLALSGVAMALALLARRLPSPEGRPE